MTSPMPDFSALLAQAQQMQQQVAQAQEQLVDLRATGTSGGGLVTAVVDGAGELLSLTIAPQAVDPDDPDAMETLADLVVAAVRDAKHEVEQQATGHMQAATGDLAALGESLGGLLGGAFASPSGEDDSEQGPSALDR